MSDACDIWDLECHQCHDVVRHYISVMEKNIPDTNMPDMRPLYYTQLICVPLMRNYFITNQPTTNKPITSLIAKLNFDSLIIDQPTTQTIRIFVLVIPLILYFHRAYYCNTGLMSPYQEYMFIIEGNKT